MYNQNHLRILLTRDIIQTHSATYCDSQRSLPPHSPRLRFSMIPFVMSSCTSSPCIHPWQPVTTSLTVSTVTPTHPQACCTSKTSTQSRASYVHSHSPLTRLTSHDCALRPRSLCQSGLTRLGTQNSQALSLLSDGQSTSWHTARLQRY